jgi:hypothetical protein
VRLSQQETAMTKQDQDEETEMLKRTAKMMFGENVELSPVVLETIREMYRLNMADAALNEGGAA